MKMAKVLACALCVLSATAGTLRAYQLDYTLQAALNHSDNLNESIAAPISETTLIPRLDFNFKEEGSEVQARATGALEYRDYLGNHFDNELRGQLAAVVNWIIAPRRLAFDFEDYAAIQPVNILASNAPGNQQQTNVVTLGPTLNFRLDPTWYGQADLRVSDSNASRSEDFNSVRVLGGLRGVKELNATDQLSANLEDQNVHFTGSSGEPDYDRYSAYARYRSKLADIDVDFALGYSWLDFSHASSYSGLLARGDVAWRATPQSRFNFGFTRQYSDAANNLVVDPAVLIVNPIGGETTAGTAPVSSEVFLERRLNAGYLFQQERYSISVTPYYRKLEYQVDPALDQTAHGASLGASYRLRPLWTLALLATEETRDYNSIARRDEDLRVDVSLAHQLSRQWGARLDLVRNERNSSAPGQGFRENLAVLTVIFKR